MISLRLSVRVQKVTHTCKEDMQTLSVGALLQLAVHDSAVMVIDESSVRKRWPGLAGCTW